MFVYLHRFYLVDAIFQILYYMSCKTRSFEISALFLFMISLIREDGGSTDHKSVLRGIHSVFLLDTTYKVIQLCPYNIFL